MTIKINTALDHIQKSLRANKSAQYSLPSIVSDVIQPTIDAKGWMELELLDFESVSVAGPAAVNAISTPVPENEMHYVMMAEALHTDTGLAQDMGFAVARPGGNQVFYTDTKNVVANFRITIQRPVLLPPGGTIKVNALLPGVGITFALNLKIMFVRLELGEYLHASPYG